jgi:alcohol dehydrogenase
VKALQYSSTAGPVELVDRSDPSCPPDGIVLRVEATGVCRSDWHAWRGHDPVDLPHVPGHEFAGTVAAVGADVRSDWIAVGRRVTAPFVLGCGVCEFCRAGDPQVCPDQLQPGFTLPGSFAEYVAIPRAVTNLVPLPDEVPMLAAASLGCRFATAYRAVTAHGRVGAGDTLAVFGLGGVGLSAVMIGTALGARVLGVDPSPAARELAESYGATVLDPTAGDTVATIRDLSGGGAAVTLDAIGAPGIAADAIRSLRRRGRHVQVGLLLGPHATPALPMDLVIAQELAIIGSHGMAAHDYPGLLDLVADGRVDPAGMVTRVCSLADGAGALAAMDTPTGPGITVLTPAG